MYIFVKFMQTLTLLTFDPAVPEDMYSDLDLCDVVGERKVLRKVILCEAHKHTGGELSSCIRSCVNLYFYKYVLDETFILILYKLVFLCTVIRRH